MDPTTVFKLLLAREILGTDTQIVYQTPEPLFPQTAIEQVKELLTVIGLKDAFDPNFFQDLKPDTVQFWNSEGLLKSIFTDLVKHGEVALSTDSEFHEDVMTLPSIRFLRERRDRRLKNYTDQAKLEGFKVFSGMTASPETMRKHVDWGVDILLPEHPKFLPEEIKLSREDLKDWVIDPPSDHDSCDIDLRESDLKEELSELDPEVDAERYKYLQIASRLKKKQNIVKSYFML
ncbi:hypothetical protein GF362_04205 [Candidatus Dojkabacteria bacterium]|nr:hypothetical protein [Candidatus Dojkabacteria bacterium]